MTERLLEITGLSTGYGPADVLHGIDLHVDRGEIVSLIGANGAGKTTLLMSLFGAPRARRGDIRFKGQAITGRATHTISELGIALVPEGRRIFPAMTIEENLRMGTIKTGDKHLAEDMDKVFTLFPRLKERREQRAGTMSGGEQQMLAIGRALMARPELLLLDEPSLGLAPLIVKQIFSTIRQVASEGMTVFLVEQNANQALRLADRGYVLMNGEIRMSGSGQALREDPDVRKAYLGEH